jgi:hypothetical protein
VGAANPPVPFLRSHALHLFEYRPVVGKDPVIGREDLVRGGQLALELYNGFRCRLVIETAARTRTALLMPEAYPKRPTRAQAAPSMKESEKVMAKKTFSSEM